MRVVGLISGGKDSIWNLHYCEQFGHEIVCVANLAPPPGIAELDSYMYQTVGSELVETMASAMGLPLVRRSITGAPTNVDSSVYAPQDGDEVEDLTLLLQEVLEAHPDVNAVSCGAILSDYQRCRVEHVCSRLGLKVLAFLWRQDQSLLLEQMIAGQLDARIVKVACMGLDERHIGKSILSANFSAHIMALGRKWGVHVCGEGGEYESAVFDAPIYRSGRLCLPEGAVEAVAHPSGEGDGVALMQLRELPTLDAKAEEEASTKRFEVLEAYDSLQYYHNTFPRLPREHVPQFVAPEDSSCWCPSSPSSGPAPGGVPPGADFGSSGPRLRSLGHAELLGSSSLDARSMQLGAAGDKASPAEQCALLLTAVEEWLHTQKRSLQDVAFAEVQVSDMACFDSVNQEYSRHFTSNPPARVCIETALPEGIHVRLRLLLRAAEGPPSSRDALRVQSISTWAMACIGPYSQAQRVAGRLLSSGVLGLVPHSMTLPSTEAAGTIKFSEDEDADADALHAAPTQLEAELWILMRSLAHVLQVMGSDFREAQLAQVYVAGAGAGSADELCAHVLAYMRRASPEAQPRLCFAEVPRLPKGGCVEIALTCDASEAASSFAVAEAVSNSDLPSLRAAATQCLSSLCKAVSRIDALQVQYGPSSDLEPRLLEAVQAALSAVGPAWGADCALSWMPVLSLGLLDPSSSRGQVQLRLIGFLAADSAS